MKRGPFVLCFGLFAACQPPPFGEVLLEVDTDVGVPSFAGRLRVDLFDAGGAWYDSQDFTRFHGGDWPLSFSLTTDDPGGKSVRVRLRAYLEGGVRDYHGERFPAWPPFQEPHLAASLDELCANAPTLAVYDNLTLRRGSTALTDPLPQGDCQFRNAGGSVAARVVVTTRDSYRFEVVRALPDGAAGIPGGDAMLFVRSACADRATQLGCSEDIDAASGNYLPRLEVTLDPGTYYVLTGTRSLNSPADLTLRWAPSSDWTGPPITQGPPVEGPDTPRLLRDGVDLTPAVEPQPNLAIDRIVDVTVAYGTRSTAHVLLSGECLGTSADLASGASCVDQAGRREQVAPLPLVAGIMRGASSASGTWSGQRAVPCTAPARTRSKSAAGGDLFDEEVCVPGGAFTLGSLESIGAEWLDTFPRQVVVEEPFLIDKYEVTVGRYRQALALGFQPLGTEDALVRNDQALFAPTDPSYGCTWNGDAAGPAPGIDRERFPLTCINWYNARALCRFFGGDLPRHTQWEYAAAAAGRSDGKSIFPWGDQPPDCARAVFARDVNQACNHNQFGPSPVDAEPWQSGDVTALGVVGMGGSASEWARDSFRAYADPCWWQAPLHGVGCDEVEPPERSQRGGNWSLPLIGLRASDIGGQPPSYPINTFGVRCVRPGR